jgi:hypothetical protein
MKLLGFFRDKEFSIETNVTRQEIIKKTRIAVIDDDEKLQLIDFLKKQGFSVDHDRKGNDLSKYSTGIYDVIIVDYHGVGSDLGNAQGLSLLRFLRKEAVGVRLIAYTSRSLTASEADFFKLSHAVLPKDWGVMDSMELIEEQVRITYSKSYLFDELVDGRGIKDSKTKKELKNKLIECIEGGERDEFNKYLLKAFKFTANKAIDVLIGKFF